MNPLQGRDLGIARQQLRAILQPSARPLTAVVRIETALVWFVNGDAVCFPSLTTLRDRVAEENGGVGLHRSTIAGHISRLPHFVTVGHFARSENSIRNGALRGVAVRAVHPEVADELGFPPLLEALERLRKDRWVLLSADFVTHFVATSDNGSKTL